MRSAWKSIRRLLKRLGITSGATLVLHTWNQRLMLHPHVHVLIPAGGLSPDGKRWISTGAKEREFLQLHLGKQFRYYFIKGVISLHRCGHLWLAGMLTQYDRRSAMKDWSTRFHRQGFTCWFSHRQRNRRLPKMYSSIWLATFRAVRSPTVGWSPMSTAW